MSESINADSGGYSVSDVVEMLPQLLSEPPLSSVILTLQVEVAETQVGESSVIVLGNTLQLTLVSGHSPQLLQHWAQTLEQELLE